MHRRGLALPAILVAFALVVGACGSATPALTDPTEILTKAVEALGKAKSLHLEATVDGTVSLDLTGSGTASDLTLGGTKLDADVDIENGDIRMHLAVPAMLGLTADVVVVGEDSYTRTSFTGEKYKKGSADASGVPVDTSNPAESLKMLEEWLKKPEVAPKKLDDASCGSNKCYQIEIDLSTDDVKALMPADVGTFGDAAVVLTVLIEKDTLRPATITLKITAADLGALTVAMTLSRWDEDPRIEVPPADQIE